MKNEGKKLEVLFIDDDLGNLNIYNDVLGMICNITTSLDANESIKLLQSNIYDIVFLDIIMPNKSGFDVIEFMKQYENLKDIPIIIISGTNEQKYTDKANELGVDDYILKPIDLDDLFETIKYYSKLKNKY